MSKKKPPPAGVELITRAQIIKLFGISRTKTIELSLSEEHKFPKPVHILAHRELAWDKAEIMAWLENNDPKTMPVKRKYYQRKIDTGIEKNPQIDNHLAVHFLRNRQRPTNFQDR